MAQGYILLLNNTLKEYFLTLDDQKKRRLREKFEFLQNGIWDAGVRVKKLRGISGKVIFEARLSQDRRLLFTLGRHGGRSTIYVWGIADHDRISNTARSILPVNTPFLQFEPHAEEELPEVLIDELGPDYYTQEDIEEKSPEDYGPQKWVVLTDQDWKRLLLASGGKKEQNFEIFLFLTSEQNRVLEMDPPVLLSGTAGSGKTTISVYYLLRKELLQKNRAFITCSPFLKRFSERIYDGLVSHTDLEEGLRPHFYVFRELLQDILRKNGKEVASDREVGFREFQRIFSDHRLAGKYDAELVWEEIRSIIKGAKPPLSPRRYSRLAEQWFSGRASRAALGELKDHLLELKNFGFIHKIERAVEKKTRYSCYDRFVQELDSSTVEDRNKSGAPAPPGTPASAGGSTGGISGGHGRGGAGRHEGASGRGDACFILREIQKIIDKKANSFSSPLLSFDEYLMLGKKRAPNFIYDRKDLYSIAEYYQARLEKEGLWDEIDLTRKAIRLLEHSPEGFVYDFIACDEVQDFSDVQLSLVFRIAGSARNLFFAGDTKQIINPSGFRWEEVKSRFYERGIEVPRVVGLNLNFRCVGNIVMLSNALLGLKQRLVGLSGEEQREEWKFRGKPPILVRGWNQEELLEKIRITGAGQVLLVRTPAEGRKLKKALGTELVFTIYEAKGLEFDTVFLWKFTEHGKSSSIWRRIRDGHSFDTGHYPHLKHEINLLYVAVTRARNNLVIYDGPEPSDVWGVEELEKLLYRTDSQDDLLKVWQKVSSPSEWEDQGDYFFDREHYRAAAECFRNAGNTSKADKARAFILEDSGHTAAAAGLFEKYGLFQRAAENYEKAGDYTRALAVWEKLGNHGRAQLCRIRLHESSGNYNLAAREWEKRGDMHKALRNWEKAANYEKLAGYHLSGRRYLEAAGWFEKAGQIEEAVRCYKKAKKYLEAASLYFRMGDYRSAAGLYKKLKRTEELIKCYQNLGDYYSLGRVYEKSHSSEKAVKYFRQFAEVSDENRRMLQAEADKLYRGRKHLRAALRYSALGMYLKSAPIYLKSKNYNMALKEYSELGDHAGMAGCYNKKGDHYLEALEFEKSNLPNREELALDAFDKYIHPTWFYHRQRADRLFSEGEGLMDSGEFEKALTRFKAIRYEEGILEAYTNLDRDREALEYFFEHEMLEEAEIYVSDKNNINITPGLVRKLFDTLPNKRTWSMREKSRSRVGLMVKLLRCCLEGGRSEETIGLVNEMVHEISVRFFFDLDAHFPQSYLDLALELRNYNALITVIGLQFPEYSRRKRIPKKVHSFFSRIKKEAEKSGDPLLLACYYYTCNRDAFNDILGKLQVDAGNVELFIHSKHYMPLVEYLESVNDTNRAAVVCRSHHDFKLAARVYERAGDFKNAGKCHMERKDYEKALKCFEQAGDEPAAARAYEKMEQYRKAMEIWQRLGRKREISRLQKRMEKDAAKNDQLGLF
ncbi:MAG: UvrD-helicase domain-containing protein [Spirochaetota bacterium]